MNWLATNHDALEGLASLATFLTLIAFTVGGWFALFRYRSDKREAEWNRAHALYGNFLDAALQNPEMHPRFWSTAKAKDIIQQNRYVYFVAKFLWACEEILTSPHADETWPLAVQVIMREHADYLASDHFALDKEFYYEPVKLLINQVIAEFRLEQSNA